MKKTKKSCRAAEQVKEIVQNTQLQVAFHFACPIYVIERPDFLEAVNEVSEQSLAQSREKNGLDEIYPVVMSGDLSSDERTQKFVEFVGATGWNILSEQGYAMQDNGVTILEMWTQEHHKHSAMEQHVHGYGAQIVGFYFLEVPENCSRLIFHDPRAGKILTDLPQQDVNNATIASQMINFEPKPGLLVFSNAWLAHSFTRHASDKPIKFVHFNLGVQAMQAAPACPAPAAEVI